jgi:hypothetical protein
MPGWWLKVPLQWRMISYITVAVALVCLVGFLALGGGDVRDLRGGM